ncbi:pilus assembly protein PilP [Pseudoalteromonas sp. MTN2-4]|uniref:pilus assembly protein PilP n=1 Tax=Pseudoalteromonas sp. MTN2-4 TaxID=3056555 RepID=UPI0036F2809C
MHLKSVAISLSLIFLAACNDDTAQQKEFIDQVQASATPKVEPIPNMKEFEYFPYSAGTLRSPFDAPQPEVIESRLVQVKNCLQPDQNRARDPLEKYPIDNLVMKGTIALSGVTWALIRAADQGLFRVKQGEYMGLYHGEVVGIYDDHVELLELIPDGTGCWKERLTKVEIIESTQLSASE